MTMPPALPTALPVPDVSLPDAQAWATALGWSVPVPFARLAALAKEHLERQRWKSIGEAWPTPGQSVEVVVMTQGTGERFVTEASFSDTPHDTPDLLWPWHHDERGQPIPDATLAELNLDTLKRRAYGASFSMAGGDWSARFPGPLFSRRGMDYVQKDTHPLLIITHWREAVQAPEHLPPPAHLADLLAGAGPMPSNG